MQRTLLMVFMRAGLILTFAGWLLWSCTPGTDPSQNNDAGTKTDTDTQSEADTQNPDSLSTRQDPVPPVSADLKLRLKSANHAFSISLYHALRQKPGNLFFSPYSISTALTMLYAGARGKTATEMAHVLKIPADDKELHKGNAALMIDLNNRGRRNPYELSVVNRLWGQIGFPFQPDFLTLLKDNYLAEMKRMDFAKDPDKARITINNWVADQTNQKIKDLFPPGTIASNTKLVLVNAIYFLGRWLEIFDKSYTMPRNFWVEGTRQQAVPTMYQRTLDFASYAKVDKAELVELPYQSEKYRRLDISMVIVLPDDGYSLQELEAKLTADMLTTWINALQHRRNLTLSLPKFSLEQSFQLNDTLQALGMKLAFGGGDFSGVSPQSIQLAAVVHKSFIKVDEEGTEAAAATGMSMNHNAGPPPHTVRVNRPFLFLICDRTTDTVLFLGRVVDPEKP